MVDNSPELLITPLSGDFTRHGGIYRDVWLIETPLVHFAVNTLGGMGVTLSQSNTSATIANLTVSSVVQNDFAAALELLVEATVVSPTGKEVATQSKKIKVNGNSIKSAEFVYQIPQPVLWSTDNPARYQVEVVVSDPKTKEVWQSKKWKYGPRDFKITADRGVILNGSPIKLIGSCRHQDREGVNNAMSNDMHVADIALMKEMGMNFIRIAHYLQDPALLEACDAMGILVWEEIPVVDLIDTSKAYRDHCKQILLEMIEQHRSYSCVVMWGFINEILLAVGRSVVDREAIKAQYTYIPLLTKELHDICKKTDPQRYTTIAHHGDIARYDSVGLNTITDIIGYNCYPGWYGGNTDGFRYMVERFHSLHPDKPLIISEYGAGSDKRLHSTQPIPFDFSMEYQPKYIKDNTRIMDQRPWIAGSSA